MGWCVFWSVVSLESGKTSVFSKMFSSHPESEPTDSLKEETAAIHISENSVLFPLFVPLAEVAALGLGQRALAEPVLERLDRSNLDGKVVHRL